MVMFSFLILGTAFVFLGRSYVISEYRDNMVSNAEEVSHAAQALVRDGELSNWDLRMVISTGRLGAADAAAQRRQVQPHHEPRRVLCLAALRRRAADHHRHGRARDRLRVRGHEQRHDHRRLANVRVGVSRRVCRRDDDRAAALARDEQAYGSAARRDGRRGQEVRPRRLFRPRHGRRTHRRGRRAHRHGPRHGNPRPRPSAASSSPTSPTSSRPP